MEISGTLKMIGSTSVVSDNFKKRDIVVTTNEKYPQSILIQFTQDKCEMLDKYKVGEIVSVSINLRGREWTNPKDGEIKYFNTIEGWKIGYAGEHADAIQGAKHEENNFDDLDQMPV